MAPFTRSSLRPLLRRAVIVAATALTPLAAQAQQAQTPAAIYPILADATPDPLLANLAIPANAAQAGMWSQTAAWPIVAIHSAMLPDGRILTLGASQGGNVQDGRTLVFWDPHKGLGAGAFQILPNAQNVDSFCSSATLLSDGRLLTSGGASYTSGYSSRESMVVDWKTSTPTRDYDLTAQRWYATITKLPDGRAIITGGAAHCGRAEHLVTLVGHSPRDLAIYLDDLRLRDRAVFDRVIAKDFKGAVALCPKIADDPWPDRVRALWKTPEADYLPPFLVTVVYAEIARLAVNQAGLLDMAFDGGVELSTSRFLARVPLAGGPHQPHAIKRAIEMLPYQSIIMSAPASVLHAGDAEPAAAWAKMCAASLTAAVEERGDIVFVPHTPKEAEAIGKDYAASPSFWLERRDHHGWARQNRPAATMWGLDWRRHASVGLAEIMMTARRWNERFRPNGPELGLMSQRRVSWAIATISFAWMAESNPAAALWLLKQSQGDRSEDTLPLVSGPFGIDGTLREKSGDTLRKNAMELLADQPKPGGLGYTARYKAHLWLNDRGDDIVHYRHFQWDAIVSYHRAKSGILPKILRDTSRVPAEVVAAVGRTQGVSPNDRSMGHNQPPSTGMTADTAAARGAQNVAMMISSLSTDPMREMQSRRPMTKKGKVKGKTRKR